MKKADVALVFKGAGKKSWQELLDDLRPKGTWEYVNVKTQTGRTVFKCSLCGHYMEAFTCGIKDPIYDRFCGGCGASMVLGKIRSWIDFEREGFNE